MVRLVFVHGAATRKGPTYDAAEAARRRRFEQDSFPGQTVRFFDPYWGEFGVAQRAFATLPDPDQSDPDWFAAGLTAPDSRLLLARVRQDPEGVFASISVLCAELAVRDGDPALECLGAAIADLLDGAPATRLPMLLAGCGSDQDFLVRLLGTALGAEPKPAPEINAVSYARRLLGEILIRLARRLSAPVGVFTGDVLHYMRCGASRRNIRAAVHRDLVSAGRQNTDGPLVIVGYSLGAVILYELLADETVVRSIEAETGRPFRVDLLLTLGAPLGFFREINMVPAAPAGMTGPGGLVRNWLNGYARYDLLGFRCSPVFSAARDFEIRLDAGIVDAHTAYFHHRDVYRRLRDHMPVAV